jgi:acyl-CoA thioesterase
VCTQHIEFRITGIYPFTGSEVRAVQGWGRPKTPTSLLGPAYLAFLADTYWPAFYSALDAPRPAATIMFTMEFFGDLDAEQSEAPVFFRSSSPVSSGGYAMEQRELWTSDGRLLALNQQTLCIIK